MTDPIRLSKRLIEIIGCSRREADLYIEGGWVLVDGVVVEEPQFKVEDQCVELLADAILAPVEPVTLLVNLSPGNATECLTDSIDLDSQWSEDSSGTRPLRRHFSRLTPCIALQAGAMALPVSQGTLLTLYPAALPAHALFWTPPCSTMTYCAAFATCSTSARHNWRGSSSSAASRSLRSISSPY